MVVDVLLWVFAATCIWILGQFCRPERTLPPNIRVESFPLVLPIDSKDPFSATTSDDCSKALAVVSRPTYSVSAVELLSNAPTTFFKGGSSAGLFAAPSGAFLNVPGGTENPFCDFAENCTDEPPTSNYIAIGGDSLNDTATYRLLYQESNAVCVQIWDATRACDPAWTPTPSAIGPETVAFLTSDLRSLNVAFVSSVGNTSITQASVADHKFSPRISTAVTGVSLSNSYVLIDTALDAVTPSVSIFTFDPSTKTLHRTQHWSELRGLKQESPYNVGSLQFYYRQAVWYPSLDLLGVLYAASNLSEWCLNFYRPGEAWPAYLPLVVAGSPQQQNFSANVFDYPPTRLGNATPPTVAVIENASGATESVLPVWLTSVFNDQLPQTI